MYFERATKFGKIVLNLCGSIKKISFLTGMQHLKILTLENLKYIEDQTPLLTLQQLDVLKLKSLHIMDLNITRKLTQVNKNVEIIE